MPQTLIRCPNRIPCLGSETMDGDYPIRNLSAEAPDFALWYCVGYSKKPSPLGQVCADPGAYVMASSIVSQADACALAQFLADAADVCDAAGGGDNPIITPDDPPPKNPPCDDTSCGRNRQCVNGECQPAQPINDFGIIFRKGGSNIETTLGVLSPAKCCLDTDYVGRISVRGLPPFLWTLNGGLPPGLTFLDGVIRGAASVPGTFSISVTVTGASGNQDTKTFDLAVVEIVNSSPLADAQVLQAYAVTMAQIAGTPPISWQLDSGTLPPGLSLDESTGNLAGTPPALIGGLPNEGGTYNFTVSMQDEAT